MSKAEDWMKPDEIDLDDALGQAIGDAMAPERRGGKDFREGVQERLDEAIRPPMEMSGFVRWAAAFLPPILLPKTLAKGGAMVGGLAVKKAGWKLIPGVLAFPAVVLVMLTVTFALGLRRASVRGSQQLKRKDAQSEVAAWWRKYVIPVVLMVFALGWFGTKAPLEALMMFVMFSMVSLLGILGVLVRAGFATRREVGYRAGSFLFGLVVYSQVLATLPLINELGQEWAMGLPISMVLGAMICIFLGTRDNAAGKEAWKGWLALVVGTILVSLYLGLGQMTRSPVSRADAVAYMEGGFRSGNKMQWEQIHLPGLAVNLLADGGELPELDTYKEALWTWIDAERAKGPGEGVNPLSLVEPGLLGLLRDEDYEALSDDYKQENLLVKSTALGDIRHSVTQIEIRARSKPLTPQETEWLVQRILKGVEPVGAFDCLEDLYLRWQVLVRLGRPEAALELASNIELSLMATWAPRLDGKQACFALGASSLEPNELLEEPLRHLTFVWLPSTDMAMRLMMEFGVPEGVDLRLVHRYLAEEGMSHGFRRVRGSHARAAAMRSRLESSIGLEGIPEPSLLQLLLSYRVFLAGLALSCFCVFVTLRAPKTMVAIADSNEDPPSDSSGK